VVRQNFQVEVVIGKGDGHLETRKYRGEEPVCQASGLDKEGAPGLAIWGRAET
jgi:hypothetical protein